MFMVGEGQVGSSQSLRGLEVGASHPFPVWASLSPSPGCTNCSIGQQLASYHFIRTIQRAC